MATMSSFRKEKQKKKQLDAALTKWKAWANLMGLAHASVKSGARQIEAATYPGRTVNAVIRDFANRPAAVEPEPEHIDYSDRTEKLANAYRKNAPAMREADMKSENIIEPKPVSLGRRDIPIEHGPLAQYQDFEPIPPFLRRTSINPKEIDNAGH